MAPLRPANYSFNNIDFNSIRLRYIYWMMVHPARDGTTGNYIVEFKTEENKPPDRNLQGLLVAVTGDR